MSVLTINCTKDAYILYGDPNSNFGTSANANIGKNSATSIYRSYLYFDLSAINPAATVTEVKLFVKSNSAVSGNLTFDAYRVTSLWSETGITWNNRPSSEASPTVTGLAWNDIVHEWKSWDITDLINECRTSTYYGILLKDHNEGDSIDVKTLQTRESDNCPYLQVTYTLVPSVTDPTITAPGTVTTASKTFDFSDSSDVNGVFTSSQLYYEMQISLNNGSSYGATQTSAQGTSAITMALKTYLSLQTAQYYYNAQVKIKVRAKTPSYGGTVYYSNWVTSAAFTIDYRIVPTVPTALTPSKVNPYEGEAITFTVGRPTSYNSHDSAGAVNQLLYYISLKNSSGNYLAGLGSATEPVTSASKVINYTVGNLTDYAAAKSDFTGYIYAGCRDTELQWSPKTADLGFTVKRFRAPIINVASVTRAATSAVVAVTIQDTGYGGAQSSSQINKVQYNIGAGWVDATLGAWSGLNNSFTITSLTSTTRYTLQVRVVNNAPAGTALSAKTSATYTSYIYEYVPVGFFFYDSSLSKGGMISQLLGVGTDFSTPFLMEDLSGWIRLPAMTREGDNSFSCAVDLTAIIKKGDRVRYKQGGGYKYQVVLSVGSYSGGKTIVYTTAGADYVFSSGTAITDWYFSPYSNPFGWPEWFTWDPTYTGFSGTPSGGTHEFKIVGNVATVNVISHTSATSNATNFLISLPFTLGATDAYGVAPQINDNGTPGGPGLTWARAGYTRIDLYKDCAGNLWTASGTKRAKFKMDIRIA